MHEYTLFWQYEFYGRTTANISFIFIAKSNEDEKTETFISILGRHL